MRVENTPISELHAIVDQRLMQQFAWVTTGQTTIGSTGGCRVAHLPLFVEPCPMLQLQAVALTLRGNILRVGFGLFNRPVVLFVICERPILSRSLARGFICLNCLALWSHHAKKKWCVEPSQHPIVCGGCNGCLPAPAERSDCVVR